MQFPQTHTEYASFQNDPVEEGASYKSYKNLYNFPSYKSYKAHSIDN